MRLQSTRTEQLLKQRRKTQAGTLHTGDGHSRYLRTETDRSASGKISPTPAFVVHKVEIKEILEVEAVKITTGVFGVRAPSTLASRYQRYGTRYL